MRISDWSSDVCSSDLLELAAHRFRLVGAPGVDAQAIDGVAVDGRLLDRLAERREIGEALRHSRPRRLGLPLGRERTELDERAAGTPARGGPRRRYRRLPPPLPTHIGHRDRTENLT